MKVARLVSVCLVHFTLSFAATGAEPASAPTTRPTRLEFTRMVGHWTDYADPEYLRFIDDARPQLVQMGFYGAHFFSHVHQEQYNAWPSHLPVRGIKECGDWFAGQNKQLHDRGVEVIGHINVELLTGEPDGPNGPTGLFKFYRDLWDEAELGPKPVGDPKSMLEVGADGKFFQPEPGQYWACLRNPHWQQVLKAWVTRGVGLGLDGFVINYFYRHDCVCEHCQSAFRAYLKERFQPDQLREMFGVEDIDTHKFPEIVSWHDPKTTTPQKLEMLRFSQVSNKQVFDDVFIHHGRSVKPDLIVSQWNHLGNFHMISGDERCLLPAEMWGKGEDYLWYSTGAQANSTDIAKRFLGEGTLQARYIRGAFEDKPFTLGKYEATRIRAAIAELAANGGAPMGFYTNFMDPKAREEIVRYYRFLERNDALYHANRPHAEAVLLFPRSRVHKGDVAAIETFKTMGMNLLDAHVLFDVLPDDLATPERLKAYRAVFTVDQPADAPPADLSRFSTFQAPFTVRVSASRPAEGDGLTVHFVNYNRAEPPKAADGTPSPGSGVADEKPIAAEPIQVDIAVPPGLTVTNVTALTPERAEPVDITFEQGAANGARLRFTMPGFLVYGVAQIELQRQR